jgi:hypothetical protein
MKEATTVYQRLTAKEMQINHDFLISEGWELAEERPLYNEYKRPWHNNVICHIGLYGEFSICELHWCNKTPEKIFSTINPKLTKEDYHKIIEMLKINLQ